MLRTVRSRLTYRAPRRREVVVAPGPSSPGRFWTLLERRWPTGPLVSRSRSDWVGPGQPGAL